jgi:hypothetical protein
MGALRYVAPMAHNHLIDPAAQAER